MRKAAEPHASNVYVLPNDSVDQTKIPLTAEFLKDLLEKSVLKMGSRLEPPSDYKLGWLAHQLEGARFVVHGFAKRYPKAEALARRNEVTEALGVIHRYIRERRPNRKLVRKSLPDEQRARDHVAGLLRYFRRNRAIWSFYGVDDPVKWQPILAQHFQKAMAPQPVGLAAAEGPAARFVAAVLPLIFGECTTPGAVTQNLKRWAREQKRESIPDKR